MTNLILETTTLNNGLNILYVRRLIPEYSSLMNFTTVILYLKDNEMSLNDGRIKNLRQLRWGNEIKFAVSIIGSIHVLYKNLFNY